LQWTKGSGLPSVRVDVRSVPVSSQASSPEF
jgi:hypothetical protein